MEKLPESALRLIYEYDDTYKEMFKDVMWELKTRMKHRYLKNDNTTNTFSFREIYPVTKWVCEIRLRRKSKRSKYLIKKSTPLTICGDMIYPFEHNLQAHELDKKRMVKEYQNTDRWRNFVDRYLSQTRWLISVLKGHNGRMYRLLN